MRNGRLDILSANPLGYALYSEVFANRDLTDLVGELSMRSDEFRVRWAAHDVRQYRSGTQQFRHALVGELTLEYEALELTADIGQTPLVYTAQPDSPSQEALDRLASWSTAPQHISRDQLPERP